MPNHLGETCCYQSLLVLKFSRKRVWRFIDGHHLSLEPQNKIIDFLFFREHFFVASLGLFEQIGIKIIVALIDMSLRLCLRQLIKHWLNSRELSGGDIVADISDFKCVDVLCVAIGRAPFVKLVLAIKFIVVIERHFLEFEPLGRVAAGKWRGYPLAISIFHLNYYYISL